MVGETSSLNVLSTAQGALYGTMATSRLMLSDPIERAASTAVDAHGWSLGTVDFAVVQQLATLSLPIASVGSVAASNLKRISYCCDGWVGNDLAALFVQDGAALAALVGRSEALAAVKGAADRVVGPPGVAHDASDDGIATHEAQARIRNRIAVLDRWLLLVVGVHWLVEQQEDHEVGRGTDNCGQWERRAAYQE